MADIYFKRQHWVGGEYWQLYKLGRVKPEERARLNLVCQEYMAVSGDIGSDTLKVEEALNKLRNEMKTTGHRLHFEGARQVIDAETKRRKR